GMNLTAAFEQGTVFPASVLNIDEDVFMASLQRAFMSAFNLSVNACYPTVKTIETLLAKGHTNATNLGVNATVLDSGVIENIIGKAQAQANALQRITK
ncbi:MAG: 50S ribosomal protein L10, partial [Candidatus Diapherotrites archaeon]|nr:50S ribosomal protein L10 [Candidatus Diapherotrites archaeon]